MAMSERKKLPPGFRFCPSDQELINYYLKPRILGQKMASDIINYSELYGRNSTPWKLFDVKDESWTDCPGKPEKFLYVFTTLSKSRCCESSKERIRENTRKKAGCGTWLAKTKRKLIRDWKSKDVIGEQRYLVFVINDTGGQFDVGKAGYFKMHQFSLAGVNKGIKAAGDDIVLCKITFDSSKSPIFKLGSKSIDSTNGGGGEPNEQHEKEENLERSIGNNLEGTSNLTPSSVVDMDSSFGNNVEATSEQLFVVDSGISDSYSCDQFDNGWDPDLTDWIEGLLNSNPEECAIEDISKMSVGNNLEGTSNLTPSSVVGMNSSFGNNVEATSEQLFVMDSGISDSYSCDQFDNGWDPDFTDWSEGLLNSNPEECAIEDISKRSVGNNLEGTSNLTPSSVVDMNSSFGNNVEATSEQLFVMDSGITDSYSWDQFDNGWDPDFTDWFEGLLNSNPEERAIEDIRSLGKRKFEEENFCGSKKICL